MFNSKKLELLDSQLKEIRITLARIENPAKFKKGDKVYWAGSGCKKVYGIICEVEFKKYPTWKDENIYYWNYKLVVDNEIKEAWEDDLFLNLPA